MNPPLNSIWMSKSNWHYSPSSRMRYISHNRNPETAIVVDKNTIAEHVVSGRRRDDEKPFKLDLGFRLSVSALNELFLKRRREGRREKEDLSEA